jgi:translation initiation factor IF-2
MIHKEQREHGGKAEIPRILQVPSKPVKKLDVILKTDSMGTREAIVSAIEALNVSDIVVEVHSGIGHISKSDLFLAEAGSRLVIGFNVDVLPKIMDLAKERQIEVRLYDVIHILLEDLKQVARSQALTVEKEERVIGRAKVIALFPGQRRRHSRLQVLEGSLALTKFRLSLIRALSTQKPGLSPREKEAVRRRLGAAGGSQGLRFQRADRGPGFLEIGRQKLTGGTQRSVSY